MTRRVLTKRSSASPISGDALSDANVGQIKSLAMFLMQVLAALQFLETGWLSLKLQMVMSGEL